MSVGTAPPQILSEEHEQNPYETYQILRDQYPVHYDESTNLWLVSRMADVRWLFKHPYISSENYKTQIGQFHGRTLIEMEGKEHTAHRKLLSPFLHSSGLEGFVPKIRMVARDVLAPVVQRAAATASSELMGSVAATGKASGQSATMCEFDLVADFSSVYPVVVTRKMLGVPDDMHDTVVRWYESIADAISNLAGSQEPYDRAMRTRQELREYFMPLITERRKGDAEDLVSLVARADGGGLVLTDDEICAFISLVIVAGGETTDSALASLFRLLIEHPEQMDAVYHERRLVLDAFAEQLRVAPPVHIVLRIAEADIEVQGVTVPRGSTIGLMVAAANRDPAIFRDPDKFSIYREDNSTDRAFRASADHISFADGRHFCVGNALAREEVEIATNVILDAMTAPPRLASGHKAQESGVWFRAPHELRLAFEPA